MYERVRFWIEAKYQEQNKEHFHIIKSWLLMFQGFGSRVTWKGVIIGLWTVELEGRGGDLDYGLDLQVWFNTLQYDLWAAHWEAVAGGNTGVSMDLTQL